MSLMPLIEVTLKGRNKKKIDKAEKMVTVKVYFVLISL